MTIYALRESDEEEYVKKVFDSLKGGEGRFGWSYEKSADLRQLHERVERSGWASLSKHEKECYQDFLLRIQDGDYVVYINVPRWGRCTLAKVTGEYVWRYEDEDFNHRFPVDPESVATFDRNNAKLVHPALSKKLKLRGRWWTIYAEHEFRLLLDQLPESTEFESKSPVTNLRYLSEDIRPHLEKIACQIHDTHRDKDLEPLVKGVFERVPGVKSVEQRKGSADKGADLLVELEVGGISGLAQTLVVQVKSYEDKHDDSGAVDQIRKALQYHGADMGLIVSTAESAGKNLEQALRKLNNDLEKPVSLLIGADLAAFFLHYGGDLFREHEAEFVQ